ncbi:MAG: hydrogenase expression/formation protein [Acidithiobacillus sp.]
MNPIAIPVVGAGRSIAVEGSPGYLPLPEEMATYAGPSLPDDPEMLRQGVQLLAAIEQEMAAYRVGDPNQTLDITDVDDLGRRFLDEALGKGEVGIRYRGDTPIRAEESIFAGLWRVQYLREDGSLLRDTLEVGDIPRMAREMAFATAADVALPDAGALPPGIGNAPHVLAELVARVRAFQPGDASHVVNLSLLPMSPEDFSWLGGMLGEGPLAIVSRGYGTCRIRSTRLRYMWWVQYYNSSDLLILNTLEVTDVPLVACAAQEDVEDSVARIREVGEVYM